MALHLFWCISNKEINELIAFFTFSIAVVAYIQLKAINKVNKVNLTYKVDEDFEKFLNNDKNDPAKKWLFESIKVEKKDYDILRQLFDKVEAIYTLKKRGLINKKVFYDLSSHYIECFYVGNKTPSAKEFISHERTNQEKNGFIRLSDMYIGVEKLYAYVVRMSKNRNRIDKIKKAILKPLFYHRFNNQKSHKQSS